jgi:hypothetical protein
LKRFFDSSVLVPVFYPEIRTMPLAQNFSLKRERTTSARSARSARSTLTGLPLRPRITGPEGISIVKQIRERLTLITLSEQEYVAAIELASTEAVVDAAAYDALIGHCALKAGADILLTWNVRDFTRLGSAIAQLVKTPLEL